MLRISLFIVAIGIFVAGAQAQTTMFTYQGSLKDGASVANGTYDFQFSLYTEGNSQIGSTITRDDVTVTNGVFTVQLDFGESAFTGANRVLDIKVRLGNDNGAYTSLTPRQPITSASYSIRALDATNADNAATATNATTATTATNSQNLGGVAANQFVQNNSLAFVRNQTSVQAAADFNISGTGAANVFDAATQYKIAGSRVLSAPASNIFVGSFSGSANTIGDFNSFIGYATGNSNTTGNRNSFFGYNAGGGNTTGTSNSYFGFSAGSGNQLALYNSFFGTAAGANNSGGNNSFFGRESGVGNAQGSNNSFFGGSSGHSNSLGASNSFFGASAGFWNTSGNSNSFFGANTGGGGSITGSGITLVGANALVGPATLDINNATAIGAGAEVDCSNCMVLGQVNGNINVGIGTTNPTQDFHIRSSNTLSTGIQIENTSTAKKLFLINYGTSGAGEYWPGLDSLNTSSIYAENTLVTRSSNGLVFSGSAAAEHMRIAANGNVGVGTNNPAAKLDVNGTLKVAALVGGGSTSLCWNSGFLSLCSSSLRYKTNITNFPFGLNVIRGLKPITFDWKEGGMHDLGLGAEDVAAIEPLLVTYNAKGEVEGVKYDRIGVVLVNAIKEQQSQIEVQEKKIASQQNEIVERRAVEHRLQSQINELKVIVCSLKPDAAVCSSKGK